MFRVIRTFVSHFIFILWKSIGFYVHWIFDYFFRPLSFRSTETGDIIQQLESSAWCKATWRVPSTSKETNQLIRQCLDLPPVDTAIDIDETIRKSNVFPIPFPIESVRLHSLQGRRPVEKLKRNIVSTYPLIHERVLLLIANFLVQKREFGTDIERALYKNMTIPQFIDRILLKRAISFYGGLDRYKLITGEKGIEGWEAVGTLQQRPPLILENCLSYDEMKLSAMVYVSGYTEFINDGTRYNIGVVKEENIEEDGIVIGLIGTRLHRKFKMDYEDLFITDQQNTPENGYGGKWMSTACSNDSVSIKEQSAKRMWRHLWTDFFQVHNYTYEELMSCMNIPDKLNEKQKYTKRYVKNTNVNKVFDNEAYYKRLTIPFDCILLEANERAKNLDKTAFLNVVGVGLGSWLEVPHQIDVFILSFLERIRYCLNHEALNHVTDVNFAYINPSASIEALFSLYTDEKILKLRRFFFQHEKHPYGGINIHLEDREPSAKLSKEHADKLLVVTYAWNGNAHPGNDFWLGNLNSSGDPAAACSTQVAELHNAHINAAVSAKNLRVAGRYGVLALREYCQRLQQQN